MSFKVALVTTPHLAADWGSTIHARAQISGLAALGLELTVYCGSLPKFLDARVTYRQLDLPMQHPVMLDGAVSSTDMLESITRTANAILKDNAVQPFDLIHAHYATTTGMAGVLVKQVAGLRLVVSSFGRDIFVGFADPRYRAMIQTVLAGADGLIASERGVADVLTKTHGVPEAKIEIIGMGVDDSLFQVDITRRPELRTQMLGDERYLLLNVSSCFGDEKGLNCLLDAVRILRAQGIRISLAVLGDDDFLDRRQERKLQERVRDLGLSDFVHLLGRVAHDEVVDYMASADVLVDPRQVASTSSALLEGLFAGLPAVVSDASGGVETIARAGIVEVFANGDACQLAEGIRRILFEPHVALRIRDGLRIWRLQMGAAHGSDQMCRAVVRKYELTVAGL